MSEAQYNWFNDPRGYDWGPNLRGAAFKAGMDAMGGAYQRWSTSGAKRGRGKYAFAKNRRTKVTNKSAVKQKSITAPMSRSIDTKYIDNKLVLANIQSTQPYQLIIGEIPQGSAEGQRVGNDIRILKYVIALELVHGSSTLDQTFRIVMVRAKTVNTNGNPGITSVFDNDANARVTPSSLRNINSLEDFEILLDKKVYLPNQYASAHGIKTFNYQILTSFPQRYSGAAATTIIRNPVWVYILTNVPNAVTGASGQLNVRTIYSDVC